jgi:chemotaxis response regulator CheB
MPGPDSASPESVTVKPPFAVIGIGASAGGLLACQALLDAMPDVMGGRSFWCSIWTPRIPA